MDELQEMNELRKLLKNLLNREYLEKLVELQELLNHAYVEKYCDISEMSEHGTNCGYALKAKELYMGLSQGKIHSKIREIFETFVKEH